MRDLFGLMMTPFDYVWAMLENSIWISMAALSALAGLAYTFQAFQTVGVLVCVVSVLLMRVDGLKAQVHAPRAE